jgi:general secretion pathway protein K
LTLTPPYRAANAPLKTFDELRLIKGFTYEVVQRLSRHTTVYAAPGKGAINLNTADPLVIQALDARMTPSLATEITQNRPYQTIHDPDRISAFEPLAAELRARDAYRVSTDLFSVRVIATVSGMTKIARAVVARTGDQGDTALLYYRME